MMKVPAFFLGLSLISSSLVISACRSVPPPPVEEETGLDDENHGDQLAAGDEEEDFSRPPPELVFYPEGTELPVSNFGEIWAYLVAGRENTLRASMPISDVGYFGAEVDAYGQLVTVPNRQRISYYRGRVHLVVVCSGRALTHFVLLEGSRERRQLVADLLKAAEAYDGLQIDFENVPARDGDAFLSFLKDLRAGLPQEKMFTIALAARTRTLQSDVYDYRRILPIVDRILVMAYDEHWSNSAPGPIASMNWSQRVAAYSLDTIGKEKLIMGLPFYGRTWGDFSPNRALIHSSMERVREEQNISEVRRENGIPTFKYETKINMTAYYEDVYSLSARLEMYKRMGVGSVGFWCLGQETPSIWAKLKLD